MKNLRDCLITALWIPTFWATCLIVDIAIFADDRPRLWVGRIFENFVFLASFFFYGLTGGQVPDKGYVSVFKPFALQFFFWWFVAFLIVWGYRKSRNKSQNQQTQKS